MRLAIARPERPPRGRSRYVSPVPITPISPYSSFRHPAFRLFIASLFAMTVGAQIQGVVVGWQIYEATRDPLALGLIGLAEVLPFIAVALYAGHVADRVNRRRMAVAALAVLVGCSVALFALSLKSPTPREVWPYYILIGVSGVARSFLQPARQALAAELLPREDYENAAAWRSSTWQLGAVIGPAIGGLLFGFFGPSHAYAVDVILMVVAWLAMLSIRYVPRVTVAAMTSMRDSLTSGLRFVFSERIILGALALDMFSVFFGGATALLPLFADQILHVGPKGLGILRAAPAVGAVAMSVFLAHRPPIQRAGRALLTGVAVFGVCMICFALSKVFWISLVLLVVSGMADNVSVIIRSTLLQILTPTEMLGRVSAVNSIFIGSSNEIGAFESGVAAKFMGTVVSVVFGGLMTLGVVAVTAVKVPELRRLGRIGEGKR